MFTPVENGSPYKNTSALTGAAIGAIVTNAAQATPTLTTALSSVDDLNKRLYQLNGQMHEIARAVGGPYPTEGGGAPPCADAEAPPVMRRLNDSVRESHAIVSDIETALGAIRRALGA